MTKILLVEDDKSLREIYGVRLLAEGYDIVSAGDGEEALAMAIKEKPTLIVSDVMMPKISGFDMLDILRSTTETKGIKVIMMTALSSDDQRARGEQLGADRYLVKSQVGIEDVVRTVHEVLADAPGLPPAMAATQPIAPPPVTAPVAAPTPVSPPQATPIPTPTAIPVFSPPAPIQFQPAPAPLTTTPLPQPTAPFSTNRPGNLGDRIIHPIERPPVEGPDMAERISQELNQTSFVPPAQTPPVAAFTPGAQPMAPPAPQTSPAPLATVPVSSGLSFEETPIIPSTPPSTNSPQ